LLPTAVHWFGVRLSWAETLAAVVPDVVLGGAGALVALVVGEVVPPVVVDVVPFVAVDGVPLVVATVPEEVGA